jgi:RHS repeat-associated protein
LLPLRFFHKTHIQLPTIAQSNSASTGCNSTKYFDAETELYYYGYRYYSAELGRWVNRDPINKKGFAAFWSTKLNYNISLLSKKDINLYDLVNGVKSIF